MGNRSNFQRKENAKWMARYGIWVECKFIGDICFPIPLTVRAENRFKRDFAENHGMNDWHNIVLNRKVGK